MTATGRKPPFGDRLSRVDTVVMDGYVMDAAALRAAAGYSGMPK